jgi:hypothetical protein
VGRGVRAHSCASRQATMTVSRGKPSRQAASLAGLILACVLVRPQPSLPSLLAISGGRWSHGTAKVAVIRHGPDPGRRRTKDEQRNEGVVAGRIAGSPGLVPPHVHHRVDQPSPAACMNKSAVAERDNLATRASEEAWHLTKCEPAVNVLKGQAGYPLPPAPTTAQQHRPLVALCAARGSLTCSG